MAYANDILIETYISISSAGNADVGVQTGYNKGLMINYDKIKDFLFPNA